MAEDDTDDRDREGRGIERVDGVGPDTAAELREAGIESPAELADASTDDLTAVEGIGEARADDLRSTAVGMVGEAEVNFYDDGGATKYWTLETTAGVTVVGGVPHFGNDEKFEKLEERIDGIDVFAPQRTDEPTNSSYTTGQEGSIHSTSWVRLFGEKRDEIPDEYVPTWVLAPPEAELGEKTAEALDAVRQRNSDLGYDPGMTLAEAKERDIKDAIQQITSDERQTVVDNVVDDDDRDGPFEVETEGDGTFEVLPTSETGTVIRYEDGDETRTLAVDFHGLGTRNNSACEAVYGEEVTDADAVATTDLSGHLRGELRGDVDVVALLDGEDGELGDAAVYEGDDETPTYVLGPGVLAHGEDLSMAEEAESIVDDLDPDGKYDVDDHRGHGRA